MTGQEPSTGRGSGHAREDCVCSCGKTYACDTDPHEWKAGDRATGQVSDEAVRAAAKALREHGAPTEAYPNDEFDCCARAALAAAYPHLIAEAVAEERVRIAAAIGEQKFEVDLSVIAVPDGIDPEFARSAAIAYFQLVVSALREQAALVARQGGR